MDKMTIEVMKAQYNLAMTQVDERLQLPIQRYVDALVKQNVQLPYYKKVAEAARELHKKMREIYNSPEYKAAWELYSTHYGMYDGAQWGGEEINLSTALEELDKVLSHE